MLHSQSLLLLHGLVLVSSTPSLSVTPQLLSLHQTVLCLLLSQSLSQLTQTLMHGATLTLSVTSMTLCLSQAQLLRTPKPDTA